MILNFYAIQAQYAPEVSLLRFQYYRSSAELTTNRKSLNAIAQLIEQNTITEGLIDLRGRPRITPEQQLWVATNWLPRVSVPAIQHVAFVMSSTSLYNQMAIEAMHFAARHFIHYEVQFFSEPASALDWLLSFQDPTAQAHLEQEWAEHPLAANSEG
ncbi:hypothetical protein HHL22_16150 [Hymenobacter sp. RP-2-7]|uniref:STAS/SEC14 domain-containing protein n=1 Tax=Hymenobacter polaris TaxID=2682546 RepID=A0A7Y0AGL3_9BACT|nr:hypothetical protein [Hymenobacter polaris]NML66740.1 hypothetical protein [Hymenobacter polaris]